jgi:hypothetical protein
MVALRRTILDINPQSMSQKTCHPDFIWIHLDAGNHPA